ncbi:MAG: 8-oxo-dGTP diphosphatase [Lysobacterales bacterium]
MDEYVSDPATARKVDHIDWSRWEAKDPATLLFVVRDGQILLIRKKRGLGAGKINGPGGKLDPGETPEACAIRECQEELHITPLEPQYVGQHLFQFVDGYSIHVWVYMCSGYEGEATETDEAIPLWFPLDEIPYDEMWEDDRLWLPLMLDGKSFLARYIFDDDAMVDHHIELV